MPRFAINMMFRGFNNDPTIYPSPREFQPERFFSSNPVVDPGDAAFGFGRRVCPGRLVAETSIFLMIAHTLAIFNIKKPVGNDGKEIEPKVEFSPGILSHLAPYKAAFVPRSAEHKQLIVDFEKSHPFEKGDSKLLENAVKYAKWNNV
jgi:hypothetical protein